MKSYFDQLDFIDIHYHANPDLYKRRYGVREVGKQYQKLNGAVVLKSHLGSTAIQATIAQQDGLPVFPSIVMNKISGGIHYQLIIQALAEYKPTIPSRLIVHFPTITGRKHISNLSRKMACPQWNDILCQPETIFDQDGRLRSQLTDIFKLAHDYPVVLSTGHASREEIYALIEACDKWSIQHLLLNQPANPLTGLNATELCEISKNPFVWVEQTALTYFLSYQTENDFKAVLKDVPRAIYSSDLGQTSQIGISDWVKKSNQWFSKFNVSPERRKELCLVNPSQLLKI